MKTKFLTVLLAICLITPFLHAQKALRGLKNAGKAVRSLERGAYNIVKTPRIDIKVPSLPTRVRAAVRGQTPALKRLQSIRTYQAYKGSVKQWRERNVSLAEELDFRGVIVTSLPNDGKMVDAFSADGKTWYAADEMLVSAVKDGRFVRFDEASGEVWFSPYKDGPEFKFYNEQLFKELDRAKDLGAEFVVDDDGVWVDYNVEDIVNVKTYYPSAESNDREILSWQQALDYWHNGSECIFESGFIVQEEGAKLLKGIEGLTRRNDWLVQLREWDKRAASLEELNISIVWDFYVIWNPDRTAILIQDSHGVLHDPKDLDAVIQAEKEIRQPGVSAKTSETATPTDGGF